jgi:hypothetical protein
MDLVKAKSKKRSERNEEQDELPSLERIRVEDVQVISKRHRELDVHKVERLAASMAKIGLRTPITVRRIEKNLDTKIFLAAGRYRLEAAKKLGWEYIDAFVMKGTKADARVWQLMENLYRVDLTALERAEHVTELVHSALEDGKEVQAAPPGGQQPHDRGIKKAAKALGFSRDEVRRSLKINGLSEGAKTKAKELGLDDNQSALLKIAEEDGEEAQIGLVQEIKSGKTSGSNMAAPGKRDAKKKGSLKPDADEQQEVASPWLNESQELEEPNTPDDHTEKAGLFSELKAAWDNAPESVRKRFVKKVLCLDLNDISEEVWTS